MRIVHTISSIEAEAAGPSYSIPRLCRSLGELGHDVALLSLGKPGAADAGGYRDLRFQRDLAQLGPLAQFGASESMRRALASSDADVFHTHGLWRMPNVYPAAAARGRARPFVLSPRGMLSQEALRFSRLSKRVFWALVQAGAVSRVSCFHATSEPEYEDLRTFGLRQPVAVIPNGIDLPAVPLEADPGAPFVLSLGRITPIKGLDRLVRAWALVAPDFPRWRLRIVGPSEGGHADELRRLAGELALGSVEISGPVTGDDKTRLLARAEVFALSTLSENFAMTVAESLAVETPVVATKGAPWQGLERERCGRWIDHGPEAMAAALKDVMSLASEERRAMGVRGRAWMERDFDWQRIARQLAEVYRWLIEGGEPPAAVRIA